MPAQGDGLPPREAMDFDVVIVGAGPAGLADRDPPQAARGGAGRRRVVVVVEKGSEVGAHILSGSVIDPSASTASCRGGAKTRTARSRPR